MSALCLKLAVFFCFYWMLLKHAGASDVEWKKPGDSLTIQCRTRSKQQSLALKKGLNLELQVFYAVKSQHTPGKDFKDRLEVNGDFPNLDIVLRNLTLSDTAPYWCEYKAFINMSYKYDISKGESSVLLVVQDTTDAVQSCETSRQVLVLLSIAISASVLILIIIVVVIWIIHKERSQRTSGKPRRVASNDVYEDMRGTIRRGGHAA